MRQYACSRRSRRSSSKSFSSVAATCYPHRNLLILLPSTGKIRQATNSTELPTESNVTTIVGLAPEFPTQKVDGLEKLMSTVSTQLFQNVP
jgi:hypothetical protein